MVIYSHNRKLIDVAIEVLDQYHTPATNMQRTNTANRCQCNPRRRIKLLSFPSSMVCATFCLFFRHKFLTDMHPIPSVLLFFPSRLRQVYHLSPFNDLHYRHSRLAHLLHLRHSQRITTAVSTHRGYCRNSHSCCHLYLECIHPQARPSTSRSGSQGSCSRSDPRTGDHQSAARPGNGRKTFCYLPVTRIQMNRQLTHGDYVYKY